MGITCFVFCLLGLVRTLTSDFNSISIFYYLIVGIVTIVLKQIVDRFPKYFSVLTLLFQMFITLCFTIYSSKSETLQPNGLIFVMALVAGLSFSYI